MVGSCVRGPFSFTLNYVIIVLRYCARIVSWWKVPESDTRDGATALPQFNGCERRVEGYSATVFNEWKRA